MACQCCEYNKADTVIVYLTDSFECCNTCFDFLRLKSKQGDLVIKQFLSNLGYLQSRELHIKDIASSIADNLIYYGIKNTKKYLDSMLKNELRNDMIDLVYYEQIALKHNRFCIKNKDYLDVMFTFAALNTVSMDTFHSKRFTKREIISMYGFKDSVFNKTIMARNITKYAAKYLYTYDDIKYMLSIKG